MLTSAIESYADVGGLSGPDMNLKILLRRSVVPAFLFDVGYPAWRRRYATFPLVADGGREYSLASDFGQLQELALDPDYNRPLSYIGEDADKVFAAEANLTAGKPTGFYLVHDPTTGVFNKIRFNGPADQVYVARYRYYSGAAFTDDTTAVEMDKFIPSMFQWALVEGLKKEIFLARTGQGDPRYAVAEQAYGTWVARAAENGEMAHSELVAFVR